MKKDYIYANEDQFNKFVMMPKAFFALDELADMSLCGVVLYSLMLDRSHLSKANGWADSEGRVFITYSLKQIMKDLRCGKTTAANTLNELEKKFGLIKRVKRGKALTNLIYVMLMIEEDEEEEEPKKKKKKGKKKEKKKQSSKSYTGYSSGYDVMQNGWASGNNPPTGSGWTNGYPEELCRLTPEEDALFEQQVRDKVRHIQATAYREPEPDPFMTMEEQYSEVRNPNLTHPDTRYYEERYTERYPDHSRMEARGYDPYAGDGDEAPAMAHSSSEVQNPNFTFGQKNARPYEAENPGKAAFDLRLGRSQKAGCEVRNPNPNNTENNNKIILTPTPTPHPEVKDLFRDTLNIYEDERWKDPDFVSAFIRESIKYNDLKKENPWKTKTLDVIVKFMVDICTYPGKEQRFGKNVYRQKDLRRRFSNLQPVHIRYVMSVMDARKDEIKNFRGYLFSCLYNAPERLQRSRVRQVQKEQRSLTNDCFAASDTRYTPSAEWNDGLIHNPACDKRYGPNVFINGRQVSYDELWDNIPYRRD